LDGIASNFFVIVRQIHNVVTHNACAA